MLCSIFPNVVYPKDLKRQYFTAVQNCKIIALYTVDLSGSVWEGGGFQSGGGIPEFNLI
jgi:hypothetical protein